MNGEKKKQGISHLEVRKVQAPLVSALIKGFADEIGEEKTFEIAQRVINEDAILSGKTLAAQLSGNSLAYMLKIVQEVWAKDGVMEIENISLDETTLSFDVTRCRYAEMYKSLNIQDLGVLMSCSRDFAFMDGFNPDIELKRTKTLMENDGICDFCYVLKK
ncbi:MAG: L-2-amino-thiazoline-4-carboxylic acid hydrolase [Candidatus Thorarchaeota archaeon]